MSAAFNIVGETQIVPKETVAERVRRLQAEARDLAKDHTRALADLIGQAQSMAEEIAEGGEAYPAGVRDMARRFAEDYDARLQTLAALNERAR